MCLYSAASIFFRSLSAVFHNFCSKDSELFCLAVNSAILSLIFKLSNLLYHLICDRRFLDFITAIKSRTNHLFIKKASQCEAFFIAFAASFLRAKPFNCLKEKSGVIFRCVRQNSMSEVHDVTLVTSLRDNF